MIFEVVTAVRCQQSSAMWRCVDLQVDTNVSEEPTASISSAMTDRFLQKAGTRPQKKSYSITSQKTINIQLPSLKTAPSTAAFMLM
jgi:hypothetical protein